MNAFCFHRKHWKILIQKFFVSQKNILILCCQDSYQTYLEFFLQNSLLLSDTEHAKKIGLGTDEYELVVVK